MHEIEPHYNWRDYYVAEEDPRSPFYGKVYSEFEFSEKIYDYFIHPQWDNFGSSTLFLKILYADYFRGAAIIELIGEWNDCLYNDVMHLKREVIEPLMGEGINKFVIIGENVLNFHYSDDCYYEEWFDEVEDGWITCINFREHVLQELEGAHIGQYLIWGGQLNVLPWRTFKPLAFIDYVENIIRTRIGM